MALTDAFAAADGTNLVGHPTSNGTWVLGVGGFTIIGGKAQGNRFFTNTIFVSPVTFPANQYAQVRTKAIAGFGDWGGVMLRGTIEARVSDIAGAAWVSVWDSSGFRNQFNSGVASGTVFLMRAFAIGGNCDIYVDTGAGFGASIGTATLADLAAGRPGMTTTWSNTDPTLGDFECTDPVAVSGLSGARLVRGATEFRSFGAG